MSRRKQQQPCRELHVVVLGAGGVGKSCLTAQFVHNEWIESYDPTIEDTYRTQLQVDGRQVILEILDTAGTEQFVAMRDLYMKSGQGFILVFSITSASSMSEVEMLREEITRIKDDEHVPIVIVGNKADLEESRAVPRQRAFSCSRQWNAPYYETSARTRVNVEAVFIDICRQLLLREEKFRELEGRDEYQDEERDVGIMGLAKRKRRARTKRPDGHRCVIL
ncbi:transforming protein p29 [Plectosphaerella cucumerina]|uniref:Ras-related protein RSR1 n=1 Tax=Plectosphaerella cucumerina TaxID=40658 RepID=A0A8K0X2Z1_9PEZI|nr:transforming protein p29 [Plectosphaerella cucumerina]